MSETMEASSLHGVHSAGIGGGAFPDVPVEHLRLETVRAGLRAAEGNVTTIPRDCWISSRAPRRPSPALSGRLLSGNLIADGSTGRIAPPSSARRAPPARSPPARRNTPIAVQVQKCTVRGHEPAHAQQDDLGLFEVPPLQRAHQGFRPRDCTPAPTTATRRPGSGVQQGIEHAATSSRRSSALVRLSQPHPTASQPWRATARKVSSTALPRTRRPVGASSADLISRRVARDAPVASPPRRLPGPHGTCKSITSQRHAQGSRGDRSSTGEQRGHAETLGRHGAGPSDATSGSPETSSAQSPPRRKTDGTPRGAQGRTGPRREAKRSMSRSQSQSGETRLQRQPTPTTYGGSTCFSLAGTGRA
ncbi:hypothetical protein Q5P01_000799 [Channa striata]|uniref:Uncharacterized protein n=1 Tax=Channa striata TaxID=64152 RepID=A0AA88LM88_CHASR|nr:hypothetical protein Q5P01_000799 [Channa striata]